MNTYLKIFLLVLAAIVAVKLLPLTLGLGFLLGLLLVGLVAFGLSLVGIVLLAAIALGAASAPLWIPALLVVGVIALIKKLGSKPAAA